MAGYGYLESDWRREALRTNFWLTPTLLILCALVLFGITFNIDHAVYAGRLELPAWILSGTADAARIILATIAGAIITVVGVVFSITIVALTMASTQFGPRMLRNFLRDLGTQLTLGAFVATFCYAVITLVSVGGGPQGAFVPHLSVTTALVLTLVDVGVLIYFLNHVASMIQLPVVIAGVATTLADEIAAQDTSGDRDSGPQRGPSYEDLMVRLESAGAEIRTPHSGYLQVLRHESLLKMAAANDAVLYLTLSTRPLHGHRPGDGEGMAAGGRCEHRAESGSRSGDRPVPHSRAGYFVRFRPAGRDRPAGPVTGGQRHLHRTDLYRLAR